MSKSNVSIFMRKLLTFVIWGFVFLLVLVSIGIIKSNDGGNSIVKELVYTAISAGIFLYAIYKLREVVNSISKGQPFNKENVSSFKKIAYSIFLLGLFDTVMNFPTAEGSLLIGTPYGGIETYIFVYIVMGCLALVFAEVFDQARKIKEENDLTI